VQNANTGLLFVGTWRQRRHHWGAVVQVVDKYWCRKRRLTERLNSARA